MLERLAKFPDVHVAIISGRQLDDLQRKVGVEGLTYAGNHGLEIKHPDNQKFSYGVPQVSNNYHTTGCPKEKWNRSCSVHLGTNTMLRK